MYRFVTLCFSLHYTAVAFTKLVEPTNMNLKNFLFNSQGAFRSRHFLVGFVLASAYYVAASPAHAETSIPYSSPTLICQHKSLGNQDGLLLSQIANPTTKAQCEGACGSDQRGLSSFQSCVHECYWETDKWKKACDGKRYC